jgi:hypothetical protein
VSARRSLKSKIPARWPARKWRALRPRKNPSLPRPENGLKGFKKIFLKPGEKQTVTIPLDQRAFAYFDPAKAGWVAEAGDYQIQIGSSSRDLRLKDRFHLDQTRVAK